MKYLLLFISLFVATFLGAGVAHAQGNTTSSIVGTNVTLVWEAEAYTPPFYKGKALLPDGGNVKILAFPSFDAGDASEFFYKWKIDGEVIQDASGIGRSVFLHSGGLFGGSPLIVVEVLKNNQQIGVGAVRVPLTRPRVLIYENLPLAGIFFGNQVSVDSKEEVSLETYPLFFSVKNKDASSLTYVWSVNGVRVENPLGNASRLVLRAGSGGTTTVGASLTNEEYVLESANNTVNVILEP